jgi:hypothetical protein
VTDKICSTEKVTQNMAAQFDVVPQVILRALRAKVARAGFYCVRQSKEKCSSINLQQLNAASIYLGTTFHQLGQREFAQ